MIFVTKLNGQSYLLNNRLIEAVEEKPDTTLTMTSGKVLIVKETLEELQNKIIEFESGVMSKGLEQLRQQDEAN